MSRILIIEDDVSIAELQRDYLEMSGFEVEMEGDGARGLERALAEDFDLLLVDVMLPGADGFQICRRLRAQKETPLLIVSAKGAEVDKIRALGLGADDYIVKPFSPAELVARVRAHLERYRRLCGAEQHRQESDIQVGRISIQPASRKVFVEGKEISLPNKEYDLLLHMAEHLGTVLSKDELLRQVWGVDAMIETATVAVHVNRLREKIERDPSRPELIQTVWGIGYRFGC